MFKRLIKLIKKQPEQTQCVAVNPRPHPQSANPQRPGIFNLPADWEPLDSVLDTTRIPGTGLEIGTAARVVETNRQERIEINQRRGIRGGCGHMIFSVNEIGGTCVPCSMEAAQLLNQGLISQQQAEEHTLYCTDCASYCLGCFSQCLCARHTRLFQGPTGRIVPLCPACYERLNHTSFFEKIIRFLIGK